MRHRKRRRGAAGRGPAWLRRLTGGQEIRSSNLLVPTSKELTLSINVSGQRYGTDMASISSKERRWLDTDLANAVVVSKSWRGVMRELGLCVTSAGSIRVVKRQVALLGLDISHFTGQRAWSDAELKRAVPQSHSWNELLAAIGVKSNSGDERTRIKAHALRLGLDLGSLTGELQPTQSRLSPEPALSNLREAATSLAASWFALCGFNSAIPVEPTLHDLLVSMPDGIKRVQVKTTTHNTRSGWLIQVGRRPYSASKNARLVPYDPDLIDLFFIVDGNMSMYLIPSQALA
jgi:hypothetical protein